MSNTVEQAMHAQHTDVLGQSIEMGSYVVYVYKPPGSNARGRLTIGRVTGTTKKQVKIEIKSDIWREHIFRPGNDVLVLRGDYEDLMMLQKIQGNLRVV